MTSVEDHGLEVNGVPCVNSLSSHYAFSTEKGLFGSFERQDVLVIGAGIASISAVHQLANSQAPGGLTRTPQERS